MNILTFSSERLDKITNEMRELEEKLAHLEASSIKDLWLRDLEELEREYKSKFNRTAPAVNGHSAPRAKKHSSDDEEEEKTVSSKGIKAPVPEHRKIVMH